MVARVPVGRVLVGYLVPEESPSGRPLINYPLPQGTEVPGGELTNFEKELIAGAVLGATTATLGAGIWKAGGGDEPVIEELEPTDDVGEWVNNLVDTGQEVGWTDGTTDYWATFANGADTVASSSSTLAETTILGPEEIALNVEAATPEILDTLGIIGEIFWDALFATELAL